MQSTNKHDGPPIKVGIVGTGGICRGLAKILSRRQDMIISGILSRRKGHIEDLGVDQSYVTLVPEKVFEASDVVVVSTGDPIHSTAMISRAFEYGLPVVTMDADTQVLSGSWLAQRGVITEANGDQPGCLALLRSEALQMGFTPLVYGNIKGFLNHNPNIEDMRYWAQKQGYSLTSVTSFTDGTKLQIEQCLVANAFDAEIAKQGLIGLETNNFEEGAHALGAEAKKLGVVLSDYLISRQAPPGVFITATHHEDVAKDLKTYKLGDGPYYLLYRPSHLCFFEIPGSILQLMRYDEPLLVSRPEPSVSVAAIAKRKLEKGVVLEKGIGSMDVRGEAINIASRPDHVPISLMSNVRISRSVEPGEILTFADVEIPDSLAHSIWQQVVNSYTQQKVTSDI